MSKEEDLRESAEESLTDWASFHMAQVTCVVSIPHIRNLVECVMRDVQQEIDENGARWIHQAAASKGRIRGMGR